MVDEIEYMPSACRRVYTLEFEAQKIQNAMEVGRWPVYDDAPSAGVLTVRVRMYPLALSLARVSRTRSVNPKRRRAELGE